MTLPLVRVALYLAMIGALSTAGFLGWDDDVQTRDERRTLAGLDTGVARVWARVAETRAAMLAYVAVGQDVEFWRGRVGEAVGTLKGDLSGLRQVIAEGSALNDVDAAAAALESFIAFNDRVGRLTRSDELTAASAAVFGEGTEHLAAVLRHVDAARQAEVAAFEANEAGRSQRLGAAAAAAAGITLVAGALLLPAWRRRTEPAASAGVLDGEAGATAGEAAPPLAVAAARSRSAALGAAGDDSGATAQPRPDDGPILTLSPPPPPPGEAADAYPRHDRRQGSELKAMAELCTDFSRLGDAGELPALLERAARLVDASGVIVWVADPLANVLEPALAYGYPAQALARLPAIPRGADNATAAAWREAAMQVVRTNGMTPGALATPILTPAGCIGVLAAEVRHGRESSEAVRALTRIVAAQMATLVSPPAARAREASVSS